MYGHSAVLDVHMKVLVSVCVWVCVVECEACGSHKGAVSIVIDPLLP